MGNTMSVTTGHTYYDDLVEGHAFPPYQWTVTDADVAELEACVVVGPLRTPDGTAVPTAVPTAETATETAGRKPLSPFMLNTFKAMRVAISMPDGLLHARETLELHAPAYPGDRLSLTLRVKSKHIKNDKKFVLMEHEITRVDDQRPIMTVDRLIVWVK
ncbi:hypothetical protein EJ913_11605 [Azospirillum doebereinerae]|uniref:FAS1-like dehydratase domain-containing protein n=2 Tax=Azospirillum doebereinerae TaxID=92933 RepID=A0A433JAB2_9PROT|nr:hypothetical protein EJ913_11605 [Azospirillum doebereinerae]